VKFIYATGMNYLHCLNDTHYSLCLNYSAWRVLSFALFSGFAEKYFRQLTGFNVFLYKPAIINPLCFFNKT